MTVYREVPIEPEVVAEALATAALELKAADVVILDMRSLIDYADVFVLCTARNRRHVQALADEVRRKARTDLGIGCAGVEGLPVGRWVLVDFEAVVVHIFDGPLRPFYNLDGLWADAPRLSTPAGEDDDDIGTPVFPEPFSA